MIEINEGAPKDNRHAGGFDVWAEKRHGERAGAVPSRAARRFSRPG